MLALALALVALSLSWRQPVEEPPPRASVSYSTAVKMSGRIYGSLTTYRDPLQPELPPLTLAAAWGLAQCCGLFFYNLEVSVLLAGMQLSLPEHPASLSKRAQEVLDWLCRGHDRKAIAESLHIAPSTLGKHFEHIYQQIGVRTERDVALAAFALGLYYPLEELRPLVDRSFPH